MILGDGGYYEGAFVQGEMEGHGYRHVYLQYTVLAKIVSYSVLDKNKGYVYTSGYKHTYCVIIVTGTLKKQWRAAWLHFQN